MRYLIAILAVCAGAFAVHSTKEAGDRASTEEANRKPASVSHISPDVSIPVDKVVEKFDELNELIGTGDKAKTGEQVTTIGSSTKVVR